jgi:ParB/RepB/Spo0J family partition protein
MTRIRELASELATGQNSPIHIAAKPDEPGVFYVIDGETRFQASKLLENKEIWALEIDVDVNNPEAVYLESHKRTNSTELISPIDDGIQYRGLIDAGISTIDSLAAGKGVHRSVISRMLSYSQFPEQVLTYMHENADRFPYSVAAALTPLIERFADEEKLLMYCKQVVDAELSRREIEAFVKGEIATKKTRQPKKTALIARTIKTTSQGVIGSFRTFESGAVEFKLNASHGLPQALVSSLIEQLSRATDSLINAGSDSPSGDAKNTDAKGRVKPK